MSNALDEAREEELDDTERAILQYFWREKRDVTRWVGWDDDEFQAKLETYYPHLLAAVKNLEVAEKTLDAIVESL